MSIITVLYRFGTKAEISCLKDTVCRSDIVYFKSTKMFVELCIIQCFAEQDQKGCIKHTAFLHSCTSPQIIFLLFLKRLWYINFILCLEFHSHQKYLCTWTTFYICTSSLSVSIILRNINWGGFACAVAILWKQAKLKYLHKIVI